MLFGHYAQRWRFCNSQKLCRSANGFKLQSLPGHAYQYAEAIEVMTFTDTQVKFDSVGQLLKECSIKNPEWISKRTTMEDKSDLHKLALQRAERLLNFQLGIHSNSIEDNQSAYLITRESGREDWEILSKSTPLEPGASSKLLGKNLKK